MATNDKEITLVDMIREVQKLAAAVQDMNIRVGRLEQPRIQGT
ncbi:hypothetical protein OROMI_026025 [Orobanche minor]